jgi:hypothetical protein
VDVKTNKEHIYISLCESLISAGVAEINNNYFLSHISRVIARNVKKTHGTSRDHSACTDFHHRREMEL